MQVQETLFANLLSRLFFTPEQVSSTLFSMTRNLYENLQGLRTTPLIQIEDKKLAHAERALVEQQQETLVNHIDQSSLGQLRKALLTGFVSRNREIVSFLCDYILAFPMIGPADRILGLPVDGHYYLYLHSALALMTRYYRQKAEGKPFMRTGVTANVLKLWFRKFLLDAYGYLPADCFFHDQEKKKSTKSKSPPVSTVSTPLQIANWFSYHASSAILPRMHGKSDDDVPLDKRMLGGLIRLTHEEIRRWKDVVQRDQGDQRDQQQRVSSFTDWMFSEAELAATAAANKKKKLYRCLHFPLQKGWVYGLSDLPLCKEIMDKLDMKVDLKVDTRPMDFHTQLTKALQLPYDFLYLGTQARNRGGAVVPDTAHFPLNRDEVHQFSMMRKSVVKALGPSYAMRSSGLESSDISRVIEQCAVYIQTAKEAQKRSNKLGKGKGKAKTKKRKRDV
jgi:hypothetical protein